MIFCFSGNGNSRMVADELHKYVGDEIVRLAPGLMNDPSQVDIFIPDGRVIWVMPVHSWGLPKTPYRVITDSRLQRPRGQQLEHFLVLTCGDDVGNAHKIWRRLINKRGGRTLGMFSVQMPNTYTFLPGFDVDAPEVAQAKLDAMPQRVAQIAEKIEMGEDVVDVVRGSWPWVKSSIIYPLFKRFASSPRYYHTNERCTGCGTCVRYCPLTNITLDAKSRPQWGNRCTTCLRCYNACPRRAIEYGRFSKGKGQYLNPNFSINNTLFKQQTKSEE